MTAQAPAPAAPAAAAAVVCSEVLPPVQIGTPPADFPFQLLGYTDVEPSDFVYAKTPGGWVCAPGGGGGG